MATIIGIIITGTIITGIISTGIISTGTNSTGSMLGTSIGGNVGRSMDKTDRLYVARLLETVRTGVSTTWRNSGTGYQYRVVPTRTYDIKSAPCREYIVDATISGKTEKSMVLHADRPMEAGR